MMAAEVTCERQKHLEQLDEHKLFSSEGTFKQFKHK